MATLYLTYTARIAPAEEGGFVAYCPELDVASQGESIEEAITNIEDAVRTYLDDLRDFGDLDELLKQRGLTPEVDAPAGTVHVELSRGEIASTMVALLSDGKVPV